MYEFSEPDERMCNHQFVFRTNHLISHALVSMTETTKLDSGDFVAGIFVDLHLTMLTIKFHVTN